MENIKPINRNLLIKVDQRKEETASGIKIAYNSKDSTTKYKEGVVIVKSMDVKEMIEVGDKVIFRYMPAFQGKLKDYMIVEEKFIIAIKTI